ncbi:MAG: CocE/NonD family hydrolase, partial [Gemmatimonadetes bacterium]|nr:CocE/NonD family hydrolase [Gemmatimonadota bacterium]
MKATWRMLPLALVAAGPLMAQEKSRNQAPLEFPMTVQYDVKVKVRDGIRLSADVYRPQDNTQHPTLFSLTPYNNISDRTTGQAWQVVKRGYAFVTVDVRGRFDSDGQEFFPWRYDGPDGSDVINWIAAQPWSDGKVITEGGSYGGHNQWLIAKENNPHHVAMMPYVAPADGFQDETRYNGVPKLDLMYTWVMGMDGHTAQPNGAWNFAALMRSLPLKSLDSAGGRDIQAWREWMEHDSQDDYWTPVQLRGFYDRFK